MSKIKKLEKSIKENLSQLSLDELSYINKKIDDIINQKIVIDEDDFDLPDGWTCIDCGDEFLNDITGKEIADYDEGTLCKKCHEESLFWHNDTSNHIKLERNKNER